MRSKFATNVPVALNNFLTITPPKEGLVTWHFTERVFTEIWLYVLCRKIIFSHFEISKSIAEIWG